MAQTSMFWEFKVLSNAKQIFLVLLLLLTGCATVKVSMQFWRTTSTGQWQLLTT
jgi:hypothetical protein